MLRLLTLITILFFLNFQGCQSSHNVDSQDPGAKVVGEGQIEVEINVPDCAGELSFRLDGSEEVNRLEVRDLFSCSESTSLLCRRFSDLDLVLDFGEHQVDIDYNIVCLDTLKHELASFKGQISETILVNPQTTTLRLIETVVEGIKSGEVKIAFAPGEYCSIPGIRIGALFGIDFLDQNGIGRLAKRVQLNANDGFIHVLTRLGPTHVKAQLIGSNRSGGACKIDFETDILVKDTESVEIHLPRSVSFSL